MFQTKYKNRNIIAISDTHGRHKDLGVLPDSDVLIHCGDACSDGDLGQLKDFFAWFVSQPAKRKIFVAGNHDLIFDLDPDKAMTLVPKQVIFFENKISVIDGIVFASFAARPWMHEVPIKTASNIDFLLTHGPALNVLDNGLGCSKLRNFLNGFRPKYHLFGHVHSEGQKQMIVKDVICYNCCNFI
ncbi:MAG: metallophosphoesterase [Cytophagales bacterium]